MKASSSAPSTALDLRDRAALFDAMEARVFDLAVVGGGITGAGVARDAAMRGLSVVLVEARDFASGTSSRSSKMIHGGCATSPRAIWPWSARRRRSARRWSGSPLT